MERMFVCARARLIARKNGLVSDIGGFSKNIFRQLKLINVHGCWLVVDCSAFHPRARTPIGSKHRTAATASHLYVVVGVVQWGMQQQQQQ